MLSSEGRVKGLEALGPALFFAEDAATIRAAKAVCRGCAMREACLAVALRDGLHGVWGSTHREGARAATDAEGPGRGLVGPLGRGSPAPLVPSGGL